MQNRLMTEAEWRKGKRYSIGRRKAWWGAQYYDPYARQKNWLRSRGMQRGLLLASLIIAGIISLSNPTPEKFEEQPLDRPVEQQQVRSVKAISYMLPSNIPLEQSIFSNSQLIRGNMLLLDADHPLPSDFPAPNTASIAREGNGMIPVRSLTVKTGRQTIPELMALFLQLKQQGIDGLYVSEGTTTPTEQKQALVAAVRLAMKTQTVESAAEKVRNMLDAPGCGDLLLDYAVEIRLMKPGSQQPDERALEETTQGQALLRTAWRYGFVRTSNEKSYRFRYVGKAHAAAMTFLDLELEEYLSWLHQKGTLVISSENQPVYAIFCVPLSGERAAFDLPVGYTCEVSMDNTGYALAACTFEQESRP